MDDKGNQDKNQSTPPSTGNIFNKAGNTAGQDTPENITPEEVAPDVAAPSDVLGTIPPDLQAEVPVYEENKKKYFIIAFAGVFFVVVVFLVIQFFLKSRSTTPNVPKVVGGGEVNLTFWGLWEDKAIYDPLIADFEKQNPTIHIKYEKQSSQSYREKLLARKENGPDIFEYHNTWLPEVKEVVAPLPESIMSAAEFSKTFYPVAQQDLKIGDQYFGIPLYIDGLVLIYNDTILKQAGLTSPPNVWVEQTATGNDMLTAVSKLTVKDATGKLITAGLAAGTADNVEHFSDLFGLLLMLNGGDIKKLDNEAGVGALQLYRKFAEDGYWSSDLPNSIAAFTAGRVAMIIAPSWEIQVIKAQNPDLVIKVAPIPKGLNGKSVSLASYWVEGVSRYSKNQLASWQFLKYLSSKESETKIFTSQSKVRLFGNAYSRVDLAGQLTTNEYLAAVVAQANSYVSLPLTSRTFDNGLNDEIIAYLRNAITATSQGVDYQEALTTAQKGVTEVFGRYKIE